MNLKTKKITSIILLVAYEQDFCDPFFLIFHDKIF